MHLREILAVQTHLDIALTKVCLMDRMHLCHYFVQTILLNFFCIFFSQPKEKKLGYTQRQSKIFGMGTMAGINIAIRNHFDV